MIAPILITGCARSGTSMTAGIIDKSGAFGGTTSGPTQFNKKGMFENALVRDHIIKPYLSLMGLDPKAQNPLPNTRQLLCIGNLRQKIESIMKDQGYTDGSWYYKGAKMCLLWPVFHEAFPNAQWIIVRRADKDIINSCMRTAFMNGYNNEKGWQKWVDHHKRCFDEMHDNGLSIQSVWPDKHIFGDFTEMKRIVNELGLTWNEEAVLDFVSPELWRPVCPA